MATLLRELATAASQELFSATPTQLLQSSHATAGMSQMPLSSHGNGTADALARTQTFVETSPLISLLVPLISLAVLLSAASLSLSSILKFPRSHAALPHRGRVAHALTPLTQLPRKFSSSAAAPELTMVSAETSNSLLILASAQQTQPTAHAAFLNPWLTPNSPARLAWLRATVPFPSSAIAAP